jgi:parallel beta-helix repeat protein
MGQALIHTACAALIAMQCCRVAAFADTTANCGTIPSIPTVPEFAKVFVPGSGPDNASAIQNAIDGLKSGDWLVFPAGVYSIGHHLIVRNSGVTLYGQGATIHATSPSDGAILIQGDSVAVYGFKIDQDSSNRQSTPWSGGISVFDDRGGDRRQVHGVTIQNNTINDSAGAGIFLYRAEHFTVANNTVRRSWADGIHMTSGSTNGRVIHNTVSQTGDDMIAVVSYAGNRAPDRAVVRYSDWAALELGLDKNIYIYGNQLSDQYWGRGISVVGGSDVTIDSNLVSKVPGGAGIYLARETSYMTFGDHDILVRNNVISQIQTSAASYDPAHKNAAPNGTGAIEAASEIYNDERDYPIFNSAFSITGVAIIGNTVEHARFAGIRLGAGETGSGTVTDTNGASLAITWASGSISDVIVRNNRFTNVNASGMSRRTLG